MLWLSTPCNGFGREILVRHKIYVVLSTPCNGFACSHLPPRLRGLCFQLHVMDSLKSIAIEEGLISLSTPCNGFIKYARAQYTGSSRELSTPCNGFLVLGWWARRGAVNYFQLHVMDSTIKPQYIYQELRGRLSTPCNGFSRIWGGITTGSWGSFFQLHVMDSPLPPLT